MRHLVSAQHGLKTGIDLGATMKKYEAIEKEIAELKARDHQDFNANYGETVTPLFTRPTEGMR
jgi:hypothetical protein